MTSGPGEAPEPTEEELRALEELRRVTVDEIIVQMLVSLVHLAGRRMGLAPGVEGERDLRQVRMAIDAVRALVPLVEGAEGAPDLAPIRDALSQLQIAYAAEAGQHPSARSEGAPAPAPAPGAEQGGEEGPGRAQSSGRLWVPGQ